MFEYEHTSKYNVSPDVRDSLIREIEGDEFHLSPLINKITLNDFEEILNNNPGKTLEEYEEQFIDAAGEDLAGFYMICSSI